MSTQFTNRQWRLPNNENKAKQSNYSMDFDGSSLIDLGDITMLNGVSQASYSFWFKLSSYTPVSGSSSVMLVGSNAKGASCYIYNNNFYIHNFNTQYILASSGVPSLNEWHHVCCVFDSGVAVAYLDGVSVGTVTEPTLTTTASDFGDNYNIGYSSFYSAYMNANGQIDGLSFFNYALTDGTGGTVNQIATLYGSSSTGIGNPMTLNPVAYYPLGDQDAFNGANYLVPNSSLKDYVFDFDTSRIQVSNQSLGITSEIAISAWVKIPAGSTGGASPNIKQIVSEDTTSGASRNWSLSWRGGGYEDFLFSVFHSDGTSTSVYSNVGDINDGKWHHVVGTWDGTTNANAFKIYVDNVTTSTTSTKTDIRATSNIPTTIGAIPATFNRAFDGNISNVQIWDTNLSSTEIETLYNNGSPIQTLANIPQNSNLQGWWKLDASATYDSSTTTWTIPDDSSNSNDGTSSGMTQANLVQSDLSFTSGYSPYALSFDGASSDYIDCGNISALNNLSEITISFWYKFQGTDTQNGIISQNPIFEIQDVYNAMYFHIDSTSKTINVPTGTFNYKDGNWHNFVCTYKAGDAQIMYIDNTQYASSSTSNTNLPTTTANLNIGRRNNGFRYADMSFSNASIWNTALTSAQVTEIYSEGIPQNLNNHSAVSSLVSWWQLGSNSSFNTNWTVLDEVAASGNNGTSQNMGEDAIVDGVGSYANGLSSGMGGDEVIGSAPFSDANSLSINMDVLDRTDDTPN